MNFVFLIFGINHNNSYTIKWICIIIENKLKTMILYFMALFINLDNPISSFLKKEKKKRKEKDSPILI